MRKNFTLFILLFFMLAAGAQPVIKGKVIDKAGKPVSDATVTLLMAADSSLVKMVLSGSDGQYEFKGLANGRYLVAASAIGFQKITGPAFQFDGAALALPDLKITPSTKDLSTIVIQAKRPLIETRIDKTIVNVDASPSNAGATAMDVLEKSPGISIDDNGNISLKGKSGVIVMIDGKPAYLSATDLANMLKNMPATALDQIEIMTNPSAKYDASGNSGLINIKTKKGKNNGFNGSITTGITSSIYPLEGKTYFIPKSQNSISFNYRNNKINLFGNYNPNIFNGRNYQTIERTFSSGGSPVGYASQVVRSKYGNHNQTIKLGLDWYPNKKNIYGIVLSGFKFNGHPTPSTFTTLLDANHQTQSLMQSTTQNKIRFQNLTGNFNYKHSFDTSGQEITADLDYVQYNNTSNLLLTTDFYDPAGQPSAPTLYLKGALPSHISIYSIKSDYTKPFKNGRWEAGIKSSYVKNDNLVDYTREQVDKTWIPDSRSNHFIYDENINAAYVNVNRQIMKWTFQAGLRVENTIAKGYQVTNDSAFTRNFTNLFPTAYASYALSAKDQLTFSYGRRIMRPNYQDLNPFTYFLDSLTYQVGNPYLLPQFSQNFELSYSYKNKYILTLNYNNTGNVISQVLKQNTEKRITYNTTENVAHFTNWGVALTLPFTVNKWWNVNFFSNLYNNHYQGLYDNTTVDIGFTSLMANVTNTFTISKGFTAEVGGFFRSRNMSQFLVLNPFGQMTIAFQKQVIRGKGTVRLNMRDPFAWQRYNGYSRYGGIDLKVTNYPDLRQVTATFTYRFGKSQPQAQPRRHASGSQDEQSRVGGNNSGS